jgi:hypothetical protein
MAGIQLTQSTASKMRYATYLVCFKLLLLLTLPQIKAFYFSRFINKDIAFLHVASKTLIQADLILNLPGKEQVRGVVISALFETQLNKSIISVFKV